MSRNDPPDKAGGKAAAAGRRGQPAAQARKGQGQARGGQGQGKRRPPGRHRLSAAERAAAKRRRRIRNLSVTVAVVVAAGLITGFIVQRNASRNAAIRDLNVRTLADQGRNHLNPGQTFTSYNSTPPTSGPHDQQPAPCGVTSEPVPNEVQVHDLEHGVVMVQYRQGLDAAQVGQLEELGRSYSSHVIVAPYPNLNPPVAVTAWTKLMTLDRPDDGKIRRFIDLFRQRGPEQIDCPA